MKNMLAKRTTSWAIKAASAAAILSMLGANSASAMYWGGGCNRFNNCGFNRCHRGCGWNNCNRGCGFNNCNRCGGFGGYGGYGIGAPFVGGAAVSVDIDN